MYHQHFPLQYDLQYLHNTALPGETEYAWRFWLVRHCKYTAVNIIRDASLSPPLGAFAVAHRQATSCAPATVSPSPWLTRHSRKSWEIVTEFPSTQLDLLWQINSFL